MTDDSLVAILPLVGVLLTFAAIFVTIFARRHLSSPQTAKPALDRATLALLLLAVCLLGFLGSPVLALLVTATTLLPVAFFFSVALREE